MRDGNTILYYYWPTRITWESTFIYSVWTIHSVILASPGKVCMIPNITRRNMDASIQHPPSSIIHHPPSTISSSAPFVPDTNHTDSPEIGSHHDRHQPTTRAGIRCTGSGQKPETSESSRVSDWSVVTTPSVIAFFINRLLTSVRISPRRLQAGTVTSTFIIHPSSIKHYSRRPNFPVARKSGTA